MTDISESGIEAALLPCPHCGSTDVYVQNAGWQANTFMRCPGCKSTFSISGMGSHAETVAAWNRRHPPSREEGLRSALAHVEAVRVSPQWSGKNADWICGAIRFELEQDLLSALIPTKPEAKEEGFPWEISPDAWRQVVERIVKETERVYGPGPVVNAVRAALQSKKPE